MIIMFEISRPFQRRRHVFRSEVMTRYVWLWFAVMRLHVPIEEFTKTSYDWY